MADIKNFAESAKGFTKSPLGIIALFIVLVYGFATIAVTFGNNLKDNVTPLIYFLVIFPVVVFIGFLWLVAKHSDKIYGPSDFKNEDNFLKMKMSAVTYLAAAAAKNPDAGGTETLQQQLESIAELVEKTVQKERYATDEKWKRKILWVDDRPENNIYERKSFESQGFNFTLALSTNQAIEILDDDKFAAIISDMGRKEGPQEGYVLLQKIRQKGIQTPFFIYAGSNSIEHKALALQKGAQGSTNSAQELFKMVMERVG